MSTKVATIPTTDQRVSLVSKFAAKYTVDADKLLSTLKATAFKQAKDKNTGTVPEVTNEQMMALLVVADQYNLNPFTKEIYAFPDPQRGGIVPIVSVDGWIRLINERPELTSIEFEYAPDDSEDQWISCTISRKDRTKPVTVREYLAECRRDTGPWTSHPRRMLRHKVLIQCARVAFGFAGIYDPDEAERVRDAQAIDGVATEVAGRKPATAAPQATSQAAAQLTHVPVAEIKARIDQIGLPESQFLAHFEINAIEELPLNQVHAATEYLDGLAPG
jgi:phage recombination protein Bet